MENHQEEHPSTSRGPSAPTGPAQPPRALPQPLSRVLVSRLLTSLGTARQPLRQVEGVCEGREEAILGLVPKDKAWSGLWKIGGRLGRECVGLTKGEGGQAGGRAGVEPTES